MSDDLNEPTEPTQMQLDHAELARLRAQLAEAQAKLERACEVIEWKSLYCKAEMGWYAEALVAEIRGEPEPEFAFNGRNWYRNYRAAIDAERSKTP